MDWNGSTASCQPGSTASVAPKPGDREELERQCFWCVSFSISSLVLNAWYLYQEVSPSSQPFLWVYSLALGERQVQNPVTSSTHCRNRTQAIDSQSVSSIKLSSPWWRGGPSKATMQRMQNMLARMKVHVCIRFSHAR